MTITDPSPSGTTETWYPVHAPDNGGPTDYVIMAGHPITGEPVGYCSNLGEAYYRCRLHNQHESRNPVLNEVQAMYQSEIHFGIIGFWDGGIEWYLGLLGPDGELPETRGNKPTLEEALIELANEARRRYPGSTYACSRASDITLETDQRTVEDLACELGQHASFTLEFDAAETDPNNPRWTVDVDGVEVLLAGYTAAEALRNALDDVAP